MRWRTKIARDPGLLGIPLANIARWLAAGDHDCVHRLEQWWTPMREALIVRTYDGLAPAERMAVGECGRQLAARDGGGNSWKDQISRNKF